MKLSCFAWPVCISTVIFFYFFCALGDRVLCDSENVRLGVVSWQ